MATGSRSRDTYECRECGHRSLRWEGRCAGCGAWNTLEAAAPAAEPPARSSPKRRPAEPSPLSGSGRGPPDRHPTGLGDLDLVLGGGLVPGSLTLLGGAPGIGKSTLLLQLAGRLGRAGGRALYASGEESGDQVRLRARRIGCALEEILFLAETTVEAVAAAAGDAEPALLCVDSIQTLRSESLSSGAGTVNQVRECASVLQDFAKRTGTPTVLVGHVTKEGALAGPRTLEHLVDVVLHFEGPRASEHRILRATKNRFGGVGEVAVFRMTGRGLDPVEDPATAFLADRPRGSSGSAVAVSLEGTRPMLAEVQALTAPSRYGTPRRMTTGFPSRRLAMLLAVLERRAGLPCGEDDVFVNVVGGLRLVDPAADLAVAAALVSARLDRPLPAGRAFIGEVGLAGEVRSGSGAERRIRELVRAGFDDVVTAPGVGADGVHVTAVEHVRNLLESIRRRETDGA